MVLATILELVGQLASSGYEEAENRREPVDRIPREALLTVALLLVVDRIPREAQLTVALLLQLVVDWIPREALLTVTPLVVDRIPRECHSTTCPTFRLLPKPLFLKQKGNRKPERFLDGSKAQADLK